MWEDGNLGSWEINCNTLELQKHSLWDFLSSIGFDLNSKLVKLLVVEGNIYIIMGK